MQFSDRLTSLRRLAGTCLPLVAALSAQPALAAGNWLIESVASFDARIAIPQLVVDGAGAVHIISDPNLVSGPWRYFTNVSGGFVEEPVGDLSPGVSDSTLLEVDPAGHVWVMGFVTVERNFDDIGTILDHDPVLAQRSGASWVTSGLALPLTPHPGTSFLTAATFDRDGRLHVVTPSGCGVRHAVGLPGGTFMSSDVATGCGAPASHLAVTVAPDGQVHIAWIAHQGDAPGEVRYAVGSGDTWTTSRIARVDRRTSAWFQALDLAVDSRGRPHVVYFDSRDPKPSVTYATRRGRRWMKQSLGKLTAYPSIAVGPDDVVHAVFDAPFPGRSTLYYAQLRGHHWRREVLTPLASDTPTATSVDAAGVVHVAFYDQVAGTLRHARRSR